MKKIVKLSTLAFMAIVFLTVIGANGCSIWQGDSDNEQSQFGGSSGLLSQPIAPAPPDGAPAVPININLSWNNVPNAVFYDVYFGTDNPPPLFFSVPNIRVGYRTSYNPGPLSYGAVYYWQVNPRNDIDASLGPIWVFSTAAAAASPQAFNPSPANNAAGVSVITQLAWSCASGAESFDIYFGQTNPPSYKDNIQKIGDRGRYFPGLLDYDNNYYWRIDSKNSSGTTTGSIWSFRTASLPLPSQALSPFPANNAENVLLNSVLSWASDRNVGYYDLYFSANNPPDFAASVPKGLYRTIYRPPALDYNTIYYWQVNAVNNTGITTGTIWTFTTRANLPPAQASGPEPADGAIDAALAPVLSWVLGNDAIFIDVYFGANNPPQYKTSGIKRASVIQYAPGALKSNTIYYWRIDASNSIGKTAGQVWSFKTTIWDQKAIEGVQPVPRACANLLWTGTDVIMSGSKIFHNIYDLWWYNPMSNTWTQKTSYPYNAGLSGVQSEYKMIWDGSKAIAFGGARFGYSNKYGWYNYPADTWNPPATAWTGATGRDRHSFIWDGAKGILFGGYKGGDVILNDLWWYIPESVPGTWIDVTPAVSPGLRHGHSMAWVGSKAILFGGAANGRDGFASPSPTLYWNDLWWYDPISNTWTEKIANGDTSSPSGREGAAVVWDGTNFVLFGGRSYNTDTLSYVYYNDLWFYNPETNIWVNRMPNDLPDSPSRRHLAGMVWTGTYAILYGGQKSDSTYPGDLWFLSKQAK